MFNPTNIPDSVFLEIAARVGPRGGTSWARAASSWGMDSYRGRYFGREMVCWEMLTTGVDPTTAMNNSGVEPFTIERQLGLMSPE